MVRRTGSWKAKRTSGEGGAWPEGVSTGILGTMSSVIKRQGNMQVPLDWGKFEVRGGEERGEERGWAGDGERGDMEAAWTLYSCWKFHCEGDLKWELEKVFIPH